MGSAQNRSLKVLLLNEIFITVSTGNDRSQTQLFSFACLYNYSLTAIRPKP